MNAVARAVLLDNVSHALRAGKDVDDRDFDSVYPYAVRAVSRTFWTPVRVARRAAELLAQGDGSSVLDVGSGAGKLCIIGSLTTRAHFIGLEHREHLVVEARAAAERLGAGSRASFVCGGLDDVDWARFDAFYFFNPFFENLKGRADRLDHCVELSEARFRRDVAAAYRGLERARPGARLVTYHGFGGAPPPSYRREARLGIGSDALELWVRSGVSCVAR